jgi:hypothetical protein
VITFIILMITSITYLFLKQFLKNHAWKQIERFLLIYE